LSEFSRLVNRRIQCAELFNTPMPTWSEWEHPMFLDSVVAPDSDWVHWILAAPGRQLILAESLIPQEAESGAWLRLGSEGHFMKYAVDLSENLVRAGLGGIIIRLAPEANGTWEPDSLPMSSLGRREWVEFWRRTVQAMRSVPGAHFQFDWSVNALERPIPLGDFYPGGDYVDIVGIDAYQLAPTSAWWERLKSGQDGLRAVARFAQANGKPLSVGEWAVMPGPSAVARQFVAGMAQLLRGTRTAYESYFYAHGWKRALARGTVGLDVFRNDFASG